MDIMQPTDGVTDLLRQIHEFHLRELEFWVTTDIDGINYMDDWGAQDQLLIPPVVWREWFRPLYRDYCDLAHAHGKLVLMHTDGNVSAILEDLVDVGVDALNSQLATMDLADVARRIKGRITFWGEIDRQHVLPADDPEVGRAAVREVAAHLHDAAGGLIAQFEFGPGANPETVLAVADELGFGLLAETKVRGLTLERTNYIVHRKERHPRGVVTRFLDFVEESDWEEISRSQPSPRK